MKALLALRKANSSQVEVLPDPAASSAAGSIAAFLLKWMDKKLVRLFLPRVGVEA